MSEENVEVVRRAIEILEEGIQGDLGAAFDRGVREGLCTPEIKWRARAETGVGVPGLDDAAGRDGWLEFMSTWAADFDDFATEVEKLIDAGSGRVVALARQHGRGKTSGVPVEIRIGIVYELDEAHRIERGTVFLEPRKALEAAGLSE